MSNKKHNSTAEAIAETVKAIAGGCYRVHPELQILFNCGVELRKQYSHPMSLQVAERRVKQLLKNHVLTCSACTQELTKQTHVFFVGIHNKPGMSPLDSRTKSGKIIDAIISKLPFECTKTNLCEVEHWPTEKAEISQHNKSWRKKYQPKQKHIIVLLGGWVIKHFSVEHDIIVRIGHPASCMGATNVEKYIEKAVEAIMFAFDVENQQS